MDSNYPSSRVLGFDGSSMLPNNGNHNSRQHLVPTMPDAVPEYLSVFSGIPTDLRLMISRSFFMVTIDIHSA